MDDRSPADWALIVLKDAVPIRPVAVKALTREELRDAALAGAVSEIGYGQERALFPDRAAKLPLIGAKTIGC